MPVDEPLRFSEPQFPDQKGEMNFITDKAIFKQRNLLQGALFTARSMWAEARAHLSRSWGRDFGKGRKLDFSHHNAVCGKESGCLLDLRSTVGSEYFSRISKVHKSVVFWTIMFILNFPFPFLSGGKSVNPIFILCFHSWPKYDSKQKYALK